MKNLEMLHWVCKMGDVMFANKSDERVSWKERFVFKANGLIKPSDWDKLPEDERERRLNKALEQITKTK